MNYKIQKLLMIALLGSCTSIFSQDANNRNKNNKPWFNGFFSKSKDGNNGTGYRIGVTIKNTSEDFVYGYKKENTPITVSNIGTPGQVQGVDGNWHIVLEQTGIQNKHGTFKVAGKKVFVPSNMPLEKIDNEDSVLIANNATSTGNLTTPTRIVGLGLIAAGLIYYKTAVYNGVKSVGSSCVNYLYGNSTEEVRK